MGPRNLLILFFSTVAVSLVILIIFFSLFFKNVDINFNTKLPESAPDLGKMYGSEDFKMDPNSKADGVLRSTVNVPPETHGPVGDNAKPAGADSDLPPSDADLPPVSDDVMLHDDTLPPLPGSNTATPTPKAVPSTTKSAEPKPNHPAEPLQPLQPLQPIDEPAPSNGPPVPGQG